MSNGNQSWVVILKSLLWEVDTSKSSNVMWCPCFTVHSFIIFFRCPVQKLKVLQPFRNLLHLFPHFSVTQLISLFLLPLDQGLSLFDFCVCVLYALSIYNTLNEPCPTLLLTYCSRNVLISTSTSIFSTAALPLLEPQFLQHDHLTISLGGILNTQHFTGCDSLSFVAVVSRERSVALWKVFAVSLAVSVFLSLWLWADQRKVWLYAISLVGLVLWICEWVFL